MKERTHIGLSRFDMDAILLTFLAREQKDNGTKENICVDGSLVESAIMK